MKSLIIVFLQKYRFGGSIGGLLLHPSHNESIFVIKKKPSKGTFCVSLFAELKVHRGFQKFLASKSPSIILGTGGSYFKLVDYYLF